MADKSGIEWTDATWNPTTGCDKVSPGCDHCYAMTLAPRLKAMGSPRYQNDGAPATSGPGFGFTMHPQALDQPLRWTRPRRIFVNSMSDLFHSDIDLEFLAQVFAVMALAPQHTFQVLTKRPGRMASLLSSPRWAEALTASVNWPRDLDPEAPLPNVWLGTSVEDQKRADLRIPYLLRTPAAVRFLSCEPLLGPVDLTRGGYGVAESYVEPLDWVIVGGESGPGARPMHTDWARSLRDQCQAAGVAFHFKQHGAWAPHRLDGGHVVNTRETRTRDTYESIRFNPAGEVYVSTEPDHPTRGYSSPGMVTMLRVGKKRAGRLLDGRTWDEFPQPVTV